MKTNKKKTSKRKSSERKARALSAHEIHLIYSRIQSSIQSPLCEHLSEVITEWGADVYEALRILGLTEDKRLKALFDSVVEINCRAERELMSTLEELLYDAREEARQRETLQRLTAESIVREADTKFPPPVAPAEPWWRPLQKWWRILRR